MNHEVSTQLEEGMQESKVLLAQQKSVVAAFLVENANLKKSISEAAVVGRHKDTMIAALGARIDMLLKTQQELGWQACIDGRIVSKSYKFGPVKQEDGLNIENEGEQGKMMREEQEGRYWQQHQKQYQEFLAAEKDDKVRMQGFKGMDMGPVKEEKRADVFVAGAGAGFGPVKDMGRGEGFGLQGLKKVVKPMKKPLMVMRRMKKAKRVSTIAKGKRARNQVFRGAKNKTQGGLEKSDLVRNKKGKIVPKKMSDNGKKVYDRLKAWTVAVSEARKNLGITGFQAVGGKTPVGQALLKKARSFYK